MQNEENAGVVASVFDVYFHEEKTSKCIEYFRYVAQNDDQEMREMYGNRGYDIRNQDIIESERDSKLVNNYVVMNKRSKHGIGFPTEMIFKNEKLSEHRVVASCLKDFILSFFLQSKVTRMATFGVIGRANMEAYMDKHMRKEYFFDDVKYQDALHILQEITATVQHEASNLLMEITADVSEAFADQAEEFAMLEDYYFDRDPETGFRGLLDLYKSDKIVEIARSGDAEKVAEFINKAEKRRINATEKKSFAMGKWDKDSSGEEELGPAKLVLGKGKDSNKVFLELHQVDPNNRDFDTNEKTKEYRPDIGAAAVIESNDMKFWKIDVEMNPKMESDLDPNAPDTHKSNKIFAEGFSENNRIGELFPATAARTNSHFHSEQYVVYGRFAQMAARWKHQIPDEKGTNFRFTKDILAEKILNVQNKFPSVISTHDPIVGPSFVDWLNGENFHEIIKDFLEDSYKMHATYANATQTAIRRFYRGFPSKAGQRFSGGQEVDSEGVERWRNNDVDSFRVRYREGLPREEVRNILRSDRYNPWNAYRKRLERVKGLTSAGEANGKDTEDKQNKRIWDRKASPNSMKETVTLKDIDSTSSLKKGKTSDDKTEKTSNPLHIYPNSLFFRSYYDFACRKIFISALKICKYESYSIQNDKLFKNEDERAFHTDIAHFNTDDKGEFPQENFCCEKYWRRPMLQSGSILLQKNNVTVDMLEKWQRMMLESDTVANIRLADQAPLQFLAHGALDTSENGAFQNLTSAVFTKLTRNVHAENHCWKERFYLDAETQMTFPLKRIVKKALFDSGLFTYNSNSRAALTRC